MAQSAKAQVSEYECKLDTGSTPVDVADRAQAGFDSAVAVNSDNERIFERACVNTLSCTVWYKYAMRHDTACECPQTGVSVAPIIWK